MHYIVYKTTNLTNGMVYIGAHSTEDINDDYMGSGKYFKRALQLYGELNFKREILFTFSTSDEMYAKEAELVTQKFVDSEDTYNLCLGGRGSCSSVLKGKTGRIQSEETKRKISLARKGMKFSDKAKQNMSDAHKGNKSFRKGKTGFPISEETKQKISKALKGRHYKKRQTV